jgi:small conductance mechanosensitive channel
MKWLSDFFHNTFITTLLKTLDKFFTNFIAIIPNVIIAIIILVITYFVALLTGRLTLVSLRKAHMRMNLALIFHKIVIIVIWFIGILVIAAVLFPSVTIANILATFGLTSVAIGFAFKNLFENFFCGIMLLLREPFHIGDYIVVDSHEGYVHHISVHNTHLDKTDGARIYVPNSKMWNNIVEILTDTKLRREKISCSVDFGTDIEKARSAIKKAIELCETVSKKKYIQIYAVSFSSNGVDFEIYWWTKPEPADLRKSRDEVITNITKILAEENIAMTYSTSINFLDPVRMEAIEPKNESKK